jgi:leader peptidase (prepilin peptidase)/N-methyltransferase
MPISVLLAEQPLLLAIAVGLLGLIVGSFLNVVAHRLPLMMEREEHDYCRELLGQNAQDGDLATARPGFNLVYPRSRCPHCDHLIRAWENVPVLSYVWLRGKCSACAQPISPRYPMVELITAVLSVAVAWRFGFGWPLAGALLLTWALIPLSAIDFDRQLLPDSITLPFLWLGILVNLFNLYTPLASSVIGAMAGYLILWLVYWMFKWLFGKEGMGYGDFKLLALLGAWLGWQMLPLIIILSALVGSIVGISLILLLGRDKNLPIPFGPYLAGAGWIALLWGNSITSHYLQWTG